MENHIDPFSPEADALLDQHKAMAVQVTRIKYVRDLALKRQREAHEMRDLLTEVANSFWDRGRDDEETWEFLQHLGDLMARHQLTAAQRVIVWTYVAQLDAALGW